MYLALNKSKKTARVGGIEMFSYARVLDHGGKAAPTHIYMDWSFKMSYAY